MPHLIEHIYEPQCLLLAWQSPDLNGDRNRYAVGEIVRNGAGVYLRYFRDTANVEKARELGYRGYAAFDLKVERHEKDVMSAFMRRLPPRARSDFANYLFDLRIGVPANEISDFSLLAYSGAKLPSDGFSLVDNLEGKPTPCEFLLELAGYRHYPPFLGDVDIGKPVRLEAEPTNKFDPNAIRVTTDGRTLGYINRLKTKQVGAWIREGRLNAVIEKLNGKPERPRAYIFVAAK